MLPPGPFANRYSELRLVGRGGFGEVYSAWDTELDRQVALKLMNPGFASDPDWRRRFRQEASAASKLNHPNITIVHDRGESQGQPYIVMEFVEGEPLSRVIEQRRPLTDPERLLLIEQLCDGLHYAHQRQIVHRDIKPVNLVVREEHDGMHTIRTLKILDFGIAKVVNASQTATSGQLMFTPNYVAPELIRGLDADHRSDMFAVGAVAYELLVFEKAFEIKNKNPFFMMDELKQTIVERPHRPMTELRPELDPDLVAIVDCALEKIPENRYRDLAEMRRRIRRVRERLEAALSASGSQTTVVLHPKLQAEVKAARELLEADDPSAAIDRLDRALALAPNELVRRFIEQSLEEARERQSVKRAERQARLEHAAREATASASADFAAGRRAAAIEALEQFVPRTLVASQIAILSEARRLIQAAEEAVAEGGREERDAGVRALEAFSPQTLVASTLESVRLRAAARLAAEERAAEAERVRQQQERDHAQQAIVAAEQAVRTGERSVRARALADLAAFAPSELVADALPELQQIARRRDAAEDEAERRRTDEEAKRLRDEEAERIRQREAERLRKEREDFARAERAVTAATQLIHTGTRQTRERALVELEAFEPQNLIVEALQRLRQIASAADAAEDEAERVRRQQERDRAQQAIVEAERAVRTGERDVRDGALADLSAFAPAELVADALRDLQQVAKARDAAEDEAERLRKADEATRLREEEAEQLREAKADRIRQQEEAERLRKEREALERAAKAIATAKQSIDKDARDARERALVDLAAFEPNALVAADLDELRRAAAARDAAEEKIARDRIRKDRARARKAIETATRAVGEGTKQVRDGALVELAGFEPQDLVAGVLLELRQSASAADAAEDEAERERQRAAAEARAAEEAAAARARSAIDKAFGRFRVGACADAIAALEAFADPPRVAGAIERLRRAEAAIARATAQIERGDAAARTRALAELDAYGEAALIGSILADLRARSDLASAEEAREAAATAREARELFAAGDVEGALARLAAFGAPALVSDQLQGLRTAAAAIDDARNRVAADPAPARQAALARLSALEPADLYRIALDELRAVDAARTAEEAEIEARRVAAEAQRASRDARTAFAQGRYEPAMRALERFEPAALTAETLGDLQRAQRAIARATDAVNAGDDEARQKALEGLRTYEPADLVVIAVAELQALHLRRREEAEKAREHRARALAEARMRIAAALERRSVRAAEKALDRAEREFPGDPAWTPLRGELDALREAQRAEPSALDRAITQVRRSARAAMVATALIVTALGGTSLYLASGPRLETLPVPPLPIRVPVFPTVSSTPPSDGVRQVYGRLVINALPWGEIVEVRDAQQQVVSDVPAGSFTPFAVDLPIGQYQVTLRGPFGGDPRAVPVTVSPAGGNAVATFRAIDPNDYFKRSGS